MVTILKGFNCKLTDTVLCSSVVLRSVRVERLKTPAESSHFTLTLATAASLSHSLTLSLSQVLSLSPFEILFRSENVDLRSRSFLICVYLFCILVSFSTLFFFFFCNMFTIFLVYYFSCMFVLAACLT